MVSTHQKAYSFPPLSLVTAKPIFDLKDRIIEAQPKKLNKEKRGVSMNDKKGIIIVRVLDASPEAVWRAWTDPQIIKQWWGPEEFSAPSISVDLRVGGKYIYAMHGPKGTEWDKDMYSAGMYKEIEPCKKLVVTDYFSDEKGEMLEPVDFGQDPNFPKESTVTVLFEETQAGGTKLSIIYPEPAKKEQMEAMLKSGMTEGWNSSLDKLERVLEAKTIAGEKTLAKEDAMDECEEKKLMDKVMPDPKSGFAGKERVCDTDVEKELWKLNEEPKMTSEEVGKVSLSRKERSGEDEEMLAGIGDVSAHSASL